MQFAQREGGHLCASNLLEPLSNTHTICMSRAGCHLLGLTKVLPAAEGLLMLHAGPSIFAQGGAG